MLSQQVFRRSIMASRTFTSTFRLQVQVRYPLISQSIHVFVLLKCGQACADHHRSSGEGVLPQEYTLRGMEESGSNYVAEARRTLPGMIQGGGETNFVR